MSVAQRSHPASIIRQFAAPSLAVALAVGITGCSANFARLDPPPSFALGAGSNSNPAGRTASGPTFDAPPYAAGSQPEPAYAPPPPVRSGRGVEVAGLPAVGEPKARALAVTRPPVPGQTAASPPTSLPAPTPEETAGRGQQIEVRPGDTLYGLSRRYKVMISDLMAVNGLQSPVLKPGQKLHLPASAGVRAAPQVRPERRAPVTPSPEPAATAGGATYTVKPGDSLYAIAARHRVKVADLQRINSIGNARAIKPGTVLRLPGGPDETPPDTAVGGPIAKAGPTREREAESQTSPSEATGETGGPGLKVLNGKAGRQAALGGQPTMTDAALEASPAQPAPAEKAAPARPANAAKLRWPIKGRVVQGFGSRPDGTHNDGIDIAVPAGADVLAAEAGVVAYAGSEVRTYGNLVLVRHDNGLVTAYAYNDKLLVKRGDRVKRGQPIAKAGTSGMADQPQLHFEVRVGSKPVDPIDYLERM